MKKNLINLQLSVDLEVSDALLERLKDTDECYEFIINNIFRNNSRRILEDDLYIYKETDEDYYPITLIK